MSLLLLILSVHFLADFHLWPGSPDVKKHPCFRCLLPHFGMYSLILGLIFILCVSFPSAVIAWMFIILSHFITDVLTFHYYTRNHISPRQSADCILYQPAYSYRIDSRWILFFPSPRKSYRNFQVPVYTSPASSEYALSAAGNPSSDPGFPICKNAYRIYFPSKKS